MGGEFRDKHRPYDDRGSRFRAQAEDDCPNSCIERKGNLKKDVQEATLLDGKGFHSCTRCVGLL